MTTQPYPCNYYNREIENPYCVSASPPDIFVENEITSNPEKIAEER
jgi:hypothetical protein